MMLTKEKKYLQSGWNTVYFLISSFEAFFNIFTTAWNDFLSLFTTAWNDFLSSLFLYFIINFFLFFTLSLYAFPAKKEIIVFTKARPLWKTCIRDNVFLCYKDDIHLIVTTTWTCRTWHFACHDLTIMSTGGWMTWFLFTKIISLPRCIAHGAMSHMRSERILGCALLID